MFLEKLKAMLKAKEGRKSTLADKAKKTEDIQELRNINSELESLNGEMAELRGMISDAEKQAQEQEQKGNEDEPEFRSEKPVVRNNPDDLHPLGTYALGEGEERSKKAKDPYATLEYRNAFMEFARFGKVTPELRTDEMTTTTDVSAVIPSTILNEIISQVKVYGQVFSRVRKTSIKGGVTVPILSLKPTATWIGEDTVSAKKKVQANTKVTFSYYGLECKISTSLLADTVTLEGFESTIVDLVVEAMVIALDTGIIKGTGDNQMLGITADTRVPNGQKVTLTAAEFADWSEWKKKVFAKMPLAYKAGAVFLMASGTFEGYIEGLVDANGQPIGRINYGITQGAQERFGGKEVILVEDDIVANYEDANTGDVVAIYCNLQNYVINSNMQMTMFRYFDHDTNEWVDKAILIADGKLLDPYGVVIVKKGA